MITIQLLDDIGCYVGWYMAYDDNRSGNHFLLLFFQGGLLQTSPLVMQPQMI